MSSYLWTKLGSRLKRVRTTGKKNLNWIFVPGGLGLGSEAIAPLTSILKLPGTIWHLDLPGDGSNPRGSFKNLKPALLEAVQMKEIKKAGHFPWIENPKDVIAAFNSFLTLIDT
jgi:hypothetical protein